MSNLFMQQRPSELDLAELKVAWFAPNYKDQSALNWTVRN